MVDPGHKYPSSVRSRTITAARFVFQGPEMPTFYAHIPANFFADSE